MVQLPKFNYRLLAKILALVTIVEGVVLAANAHRVLLEGLGSIREAYVQLAGIQLLVLGLVPLIALVLPPAYYMNRKLISRIITIILLLAAFVIVIEALVVAYYSTFMTITDVGTVRSFGMAGFAAQLFFIGAGLFSSSILAGKENLGLTVIVAVTLAIGSIGVFVVGIAAETTLVGIGSMSEGTLFVAGVQLLVLSLVMLLLLFLGERSFLCKKVFGLTLSTLGVIILSMIASMEGLILVSYGTEMVISGIGSISEQAMLLFGLVLAFLGMAIPATIFAQTRSNKKVGDLAMYAVVFLVLLFPFALFV